MNATRLNPGLPLKALPVGTWNSNLDRLAALELAHRLGNPQRPRDLPPFLPVLCQNTGSVDAKEFGVLGIRRHAYVLPTGTADLATAPLLEPAAIDVEEATEADHANRFVVTLGPIAQNAAGWAVVRGLTVARVDIVDPAHTTCGVADGEADHLVSGKPGATIIEAANAAEATKTGVQWCLIDIGGPGSTKLTSQFAVVTDAAAAGSISGSTGAGDWTYTPGTLGACVVLEVDPATGELTLPTIASGRTLADYKVQLAAMTEYSELEPERLILVSNLGGSLAPTGPFDVTLTERPVVEGRYVSPWDWIRGLGTWATGSRQILFHDPSDAAPKLSGYLCEPPA